MEAGDEPPPRRRRFLKTLITAPVAALATHRFLIQPPSAPAVLAAEERLQRGIAEVEAAMRDLFPGVPVKVQGNCLDGHHAYWAELFRDDPDAPGLYANVMITASPRYAVERHGRSMDRRTQHEAHHEQAR